MGEETTQDYVSGPEPEKAVQETSVSEETPEDAAPWIQGTGVDQSMDDPNRSATGGGMRFWMPKGSSKTIIFLTDGHGPNGPPSVFEHNPPMGQGKMRYQHWFSCVEPLGMKCPLCQWADTHDGNGRRYKGLFFTIIDTTEFVDKAGNKRSNLKKLLVAKKDTAELLARKYLSRVEAGGSLMGAMFKVHRGSGEKTAAVGNDFEFIKMVDLSALPDSEQFDYRKILKPDLKLVTAAVETLKIEAGEGGASGPSPAEGAGATVAYG
jgi:hypothetical protein